MTKLEQIKSFDDQQMAEFVYTLISETEERIIGQLAALGIEASLCSLDPSLQIESHRQLLLQEVDDETC
jgi:hypothetical protein